MNQEVKLEFEIEKVTFIKPTVPYNSVVKKFGKSIHRNKNNSSNFG